MGKYWIAYYVTFLLGIAVLTRLYWYSPRWNEDWLPLLSDIFGVAFGISVTLAITVELVGNMVLLIPQRIRELKEKGRKEERKAQRNRREEALRRYAVEVSGVRMLPMTPEVEQFLNSDSPGEGTED